MAVLTEEPRINLELLQETWEQIEYRVMEEAAREGLTLDQVNAANELDGWSQGAWRTRVWEGDRCQTALCFAGWAAQIDATKRGEGGWVIEDSVFVQGRDEAGAYGVMPGWAAECLVAREDDNRNTVIHNSELPDDVYVVQAEARARQVLGLNAGEADELFHGGNSFSKVREIVMRLRAEELIRRARKRQAVLAKRLAAAAAEAETTTEGSDTSEA